ncbi:MAG: DUF1489 domain-containing protein [Rhodospirillaceae bacterium]|nr:DUF1489 domain-containing protein [Rhodospirillaceae bacterium]
MTVHIVKLCVGIDSIEQLATFQANRRDRAKARGELIEHIHRPRNRPRRDGEVLDGGSLYWIIKGFIRVRQPIMRLDELYDDEGGKRCGFVLSPELVRTELHARRPHQGWRYLEAKDAAPDLPEHQQAGHWDPDTHDGPPPEMAAELRALGLL